MRGRTEEETTRHLRSRDGENMDEKVGWSQKKAECAEGERKLRQTGRLGDEPRFGGRCRGPFFEDEEGVREMICSQRMKEKARKQRWVFVRC